MNERPTVPDIIGPRLDALFVGINPDPISAREGHHFANPANIFWRLLNESGFTPRLLSPRDEALLLRWGLGITNLVERESRGVSELGRRDIEDARPRLWAKVRRYRPRSVVFIGITGYRMFFGERSRPISCGEQAGKSIEGARVFVLPHPSGRNAHFTRAELLARFRAVAIELGYPR